MEQKTYYIHPSYLGLSEYLLVAHPDAAVNEKIMAEKENFALEYKQKIAAKTKPHITIANFLAKEAMEETILRYTQRICSKQQNFEVSLNNYSGFPSHAIFLRVQNQQPFCQLANELTVVSSYVKSCACPPVKMISNSHVTIARHLTETVYLQAIMDYSRKTFHETFMVNELVLLKRSHEHDACKPVNIFRLAAGRDPFSAGGLFN